MSTRLSAALLGLVVVSASARANGRPPATSGVYLHPTDPRSIYVRATFGLLVSHDSGCTFRWVCEAAVGFGGEFDPTYAVADDGTIFATTFNGLRVSHDGGCTWRTATAEIWVDDVEVTPGGDVWIATAEVGATNNVYRSTDRGETFTPGSLASAQIWWKSIAVAPSDPQRIYVTGYQVAPSLEVHVRVSDDGGATWMPRPLSPAIKLGAAPVLAIAAIDPVNPDHLFITSVTAEEPVGDVVYESTDAGATLTEVLTTNDPVTGVVFRKDGNVVIATKLSGTYEITADGTLIRLGMAQPNAPDLSPLQLGCLAEQTDGTLIGCGANWDPDFMAVGKGDSPVTFAKVFRFSELAGTLTCPAGTTTQQACEPMWPALRSQLSVTGPTCGDSAPPPVDAAMSTASGCCEAGGESTGTLALASIVTVLLRRPRRRPSSTLCSGASRLIAA